MNAPEKPAWRPWLWLMVGIAAIAIAWQLDGRVDAALDVTRNVVWHRIAWWCSKLAEGWVPAAGGIVLAVLLLLVKQPGMAAKALFAVVTCEITGGVALVLRILIGRNRPLSHTPQGIYGVWHEGHWIIGKYEFSSLPSGHTATAAGLAMAIWLVHRGWGTLAAAYALAVMWSRIALECHHLSDVVASVVLAVPLAVMLKKVLLPSIHFQLANLDRALEANKKRTAMEK